MGFDSSAVYRHSDWHEACRHFVLSRHHSVASGAWFASVRQGGQAMPYERTHPEMGRFMLAGTDAEPGQAHSRAHRRTLRICDHRHVLAHSRTRVAPRQVKTMKRNDVKTLILSARARLDPAAFFPPSHFRPCYGHSQTYFEAVSAVKTPRGRHAPSRYPTRRPRSVRHVVIIGFPSACIHYISAVSISPPTAAGLAAVALLQAQPLSRGWQNSVD